MPTYRSRLSAAIKKEYSRCLAQLDSEGLELGDDLELFSENICPLKITASDCGFVFDSQSICVHAVVPLRLCAYQTVTFEDCDIETVSEELAFHIAAPPQSRGRYYVHRRSFAAEEVLNSCFESVFTKKPFRLCRGRTVEGVVLGYLDKLTIEYLQTRVVPVRISLLDSLDRRVDVELQLGVQRMPEQVEAAKNKSIANRPYGTELGLKAARGGEERSAVQIRSENLDGAIVEKMASRSDETVPIND